MFRNLAVLRLPVCLLLFLSTALAIPGAEGPDWKARLAAVKVERYAAAPGYSEGPTWRDGELFFCSTGLLRVTKDRRVRKYLDVSPAGTYLCGNGHILICDNKLPALLDLAPDGKVGVVVERFGGQKLNSLNDLTVDRDGNVYWTDPSGSSRENPVGCIFRVRPDGRVDRIASDLAFPNGLDVSPDNRYLFVIESQTAKVLRYDLPPADQPLGRPVVFYALGGSGGDGCTFDAAGNFWVADFHRPDTKQGRLTVLSPQGRLLGHLPIPAGQVSNLTFGGPHHDEVFVTTGDPPGVFRARVGVPGFTGHPGKPLKIVRVLDLAPLDEPVPVK
jgi:gluconolactonase